MSSCDLQANSGRLSGLPGRTGAILQETIEVGEVTAVRRMIVKALGGLAAALAFIAPVPAFAQNSDAPVDVTAAPPPSSETVGPAQLRDFSLNGTVTRQADRPAASAPPPVNSAQPRTTSAAPTEVTPRSEAGGTRRAAPSLPSSRDPVPEPLANAAPQVPRGGEPVTPAATGVQTQTVPASTPDATAPSGIEANPGGGLPWPWIAALLALAGGGGFIVWSRRGRRQRYGDPGRMAFAGLVPDMGGEPAPPMRPKHDAVPPRPEPAPPEADNGWSLVPKPASPPGDGMIVSTRLKPELAIYFEPDRAVVTESDVMLQFDVVVTNSGSAPARDVLVEARMVSAHAGQDAEIAAFFQQPVGKGDRIAAIQPFGKISLKSTVRLPIAQLHNFTVEGRTLFVPLVAFNVLFSGNSQKSASFLVGRGNEGDDKLAPFRLDLGPRIFRGLSSRPHSAGLSR